MCKKNTNGENQMKLMLITGAVFSMLAVALGAFGAHGLKSILDDYGKSIWEKAVLYQMFHALALLITGLIQNNFKEINFAPSGYAFILGILFFSGSLYILALTNIKTFGAITPLGGLAFLFGWGWMIYGFTKI
jgi:uncharacterized membrane protein YgdD (TMEM256/DUF423 family)